MISTTQKKIMLIDIACLLVSGFFFLYISPSIEMRQRLIYIGPQILFCAVFVFASRFLVGVYKEYYIDAGGRNLATMYMHLIIADAIACLLYYLLQLLLPEPMRITLIRLVDIVIFNLLEAIVCRLCYQTGFVMREDDRRILAAAAKSGKSADEIIALIEKQTKG